MDHCSHARCITAFLWNLMRWFFSIVLSSCSCSGTVVWIYRRFNIFGRIRNIWSCSSFIWSMFPFALPFFAKCLTVWFIGIFLFLPHTSSSYGIVDSLFFFQISIITFWVQWWSHLKKRLSVFKPVFFHILIFNSTNECKFSLQLLLDLFDTLLLFWILNFVL